MLMVLVMPCTAQGLLASTAVQRVGLHLNHTRDKTAQEQLEHFMQCPCMGKVACLAISPSPVLSPVCSWHQCYISKHGRHSFSPTSIHGLQKQHPSMLNREAQAWLVTLDNLQMQNSLKAIMARSR